MLRGVTKHCISMDFNFHLSADWVISGVIHAKVGGAVKLGPDTRNFIQ
jgi:hypothetical protein